MKLSLDRPLAFFDLETTGLDISKAKIVEISILKVFPDGSEEEYYSLVNPCCPIPADAVNIHGITDEKVKDKPAFSGIADDVIHFLEGCDIAGFNSNRYDIPLLSEEFLKAQKEFSMEGRRTVDVQVIFHKMEPRNLAAAYKFYCNRELENAHSALVDTRATYEILQAQLDRYQGVERENEQGNQFTPVCNSVESLCAFSSQQENVDASGRLVYNDKREPVFNFGKYKGVTVEKVLRENSGYYEWIMNSDFPLSTKNTLTELRNKLLENLKF